MDQLQPGKVIEFLCNGRGRGGHYHVYATVTKVNPKTVKAIEANRSYSPGTRWTVSKTEIKNVRDPVPEHTCYFCKGTGKLTQAGVVHNNHKCPMCVKGIVPHEAFIS
jgi:hypothetical protein